LPNHKHIPLSNYFDKNPRQTLFTLHAVPNFSPLDFNLEFLKAKGWSLSADRFRFHFEAGDVTSGEHALKKLFASLPPHMLIRKIDKEEDYFVAISVFVDGKLTVLSNDEDRACEFLDGLLLGFPPAFKEKSDLEVEARWETDAQQFAVFCGMLTGAMGWDPMHDVPPSLEESIVEARKSLEMGNYKSSIVMSRRAIEGLLKFAHKRLLGKEPIRKDGRSMMLNDLITAFRGTGKIPEHLLQSRGCAAPSRQCAGSASCRYPGLSVYSVRRRIRAGVSALL
jgi:hypothetical protein